MGIEFNIISPAILTNKFEIKPKVITMDKQFNLINYKTKAPKGT